jgi:hypothetical protein
MKAVKLFVVFLCLFCVSAAFAKSNTAVQGFVHLFNVPKTDESYYLLGVLFGKVGPFWPQYAQNILGALFAKFNYAMLVLGTILIGYTAFMGVIGMAHEGEFLGKKFHSVWAPIRTVLGFMLLIPGKTGYCLLQILLMWFVLQGVGAADTVWTTAVNYIVKYRSVYTQSTQPKQKPTFDKYTKAQAGQKTYSVASSIFSDYVCMYNSYVNALSTTGKPLNKLSKTFSANKTLLATGVTVYNFPSYNQNAVPADIKGCGQVTIPAAVVSPKTPTDSVRNALITALPKQFHLLNRGARTYAYAAAKAGGSSSAGLKGVVGHPISTVANSWAETIITESQKASAESAPVSILKKFAAVHGWIYAGAFYKEIVAASPTAALYNALNQSFVFNPASVQCSHLSQNVGKKGSCVAPASVVMGLTQYSTHADPFGSHAVPKIKIAFLPKGYEQANTSLLTGTAGVGLMVVGLPLSILAGPLLIPIIVPVIAAGGLSLIMGGVLNSTTAHLNIFSLLDSAANKVILAFVHGVFSNSSSAGFSMLGSSGSPVIQLQLAGLHIINLVKESWVVLFIVLGFVLTFGYACTAINPLTGIAMFFAKILTFGVIFLSLFFAWGMMMAVYLPLVPFIIFLFGAFGWFLSVVETMLAAPMVALGIVYPEGGHELLGRASPAIMLVTNVFIRPTLMIFGLIFGILLANVMVSLLNSVWAFVIWSTSMIGTHVQQVGQLEWVLYMFIYLAVVVALINKCFSLIHKMPDQVLRWIGGQQNFGGYGVAEGIGEVQQKAKAGAGKMQEMGSKTASGGSSAAMGHLDKKKEDEKAAIKAAVSAAAVAGGA